MFPPAFTHYLSSTQLQKALRKTCPLGRRRPTVMAFPMWPMRERKSAKRFGSLYCLAVLHSRHGRLDFVNTRAQILCRQIVQVVRDTVKPPFFTTSIHLGAPIYMEFPYIRICNANKINATKAKESPRECVVENSVFKAPNKCFV